MKSSNTRFIHPGQFDDAPEEYHQHSDNTHVVPVAIDTPQTQVQQQVAARRISDVVTFNPKQSMVPSAGILPSVMMTAAVADADPVSTGQTMMPPPYSSLFRTTPTLEQFHLKSSATRRMLAAARPNVLINSHQVDVAEEYVSPGPVYVPQHMNGNDPFCPSTRMTAPHSVSSSHCHTPATTVVHTPVHSTYTATATTTTENTSGGNSGRSLSQQEYLSASPDVATSEDIAADASSAAVKSQGSSASKRSYQQAGLPYHSNANNSDQGITTNAIIFTRPSKKKKKKVGQEKKYDKKWSEKYEELVAFHKAKGHCRVPQKYPNNPTLGIWVHNQRRKYKLGVMSFERVGLLNQIDFQWEITRGGERTDYPLSPVRRWESMFSELCAFKQKHGHFNVKIGTRLGDWVEAQRYWHDKLLAGDSSAKITKERVELLKCVGVSLTTN
eukprot:CAMPEP_0196801634 /NCGR_PEP_ID=MMETSP1362-20130617/1396_1 /TAXON_ID=163516 /ORGANISM="Leptocylindrus danicus, Strain CCMP1856" /LENGTH=441 /DNA_ID=CAMNT_0042172689 /DNA_START=207 /DNA_END=1532 /DNA_ORIENTATION=-